MFLLVGGDSEIGAATFHFLKSQGQHVAASTRRRERVAADRIFLDLTASLDDWEPPAGTRASCIFAAVARLADCAADPTGSAHVNVAQTAALVERLIARNIAVVLLSTNQVFDGRIPHVPSDTPTCPVSEYGHQKAAVEKNLRGYIARGAPLAVLRLAKVVSPSTALLHGWINALSIGKSIHSFHDMTIAPTPLELVTAAITALLRDRASGIYQLTGPRDMTYAEVGRFLAQRLHVDPALVIENSAYTAGLPRGATPLHTTLDSTLLRDRYGFEVPDASEVIDNLVLAVRASR